MKPEGTVALIYYTPVNEPEKVNTIKVLSDEDYNSIKKFISKNTKNKRNPNLETFNSSGISDISLINKIRKDFPLIKDEDVKSLFDQLSSWLYTLAKTKDRFFGLIINHDFIFIYHFKPETTITFKETRIEEFVKYLDNSTINRFIFLANNNIMEQYYDVDKEGITVPDDEELMYTYEKQKTKGFQELISKEPVYDSKGEIKVRGEHDTDTDLIIETYLEHLNNLQDVVNVDIENEVFYINGLKLNIKEVQINGKKYSSKDKAIILNHLIYNSLSIDEFLSNIEHHLNRNRNSIVYEEKDRVIIKDNNKIIKTLSKPTKQLDGKSTIYVLDKKKNEIKDDNLIDELINNLQTHTSLSIVELSNFSEKYHRINISGLTLFIKFKNYEEAYKLTQNMNKIINKIKGNNNIFYRKMLTLICLLQIKENVKNNKISLNFQKSARKAITRLLTQLSKQKHSMDLQEIDKLGIDFKAGVRSDDRGFFDPSPKKLSEKILKKIKNKRSDLFFYLIGINEDTKDFSPIPLSQIRNEFMDILKTELQNNGLIVELTETFPLNEKEGVLLIAFRKSGGT